MKKIIFSFFIVFTLLMAVNSELKSQTCWLPNGVSNTPAWTSATVRVNITGNCWVIYEYCFRTVGGVNQIVMGKRTITGRTGFWSFSSCSHEFNKRQEMVFDRAVGGALNLSFGAFENTPACPTLTPPVYQIYAASCITVPYYNYPTGNGEKVQSPCSQDGFCVYTYQYCYKTINGKLTSVLTKKLITNNGAQCPGTYYDSNTNNHYDCFPKDCFPTRINVFDPTEDHIQDPILDDLNFYLLIP